MSSRVSSHRWVVSVHQCLLRHSQYYKHPSKYFKFASVRALFFTFFVTVTINQILYCVFIRCGLCSSLYFLQLIWIFLSFAYKLNAKNNTMATEPSLQLENNPAIMIYRMLLILILTLLIFWKCSRSSRSCSESAAMCANFSCLKTFWRRLSLENWIGLRWWASWKSKWKIV